MLKSWARNDVWRCRVAGGPSGLPTSVIVKHFKSEPDRGFDDWASLEFLTRAGTAPALCPQFLAGDARAQVFVIEDLREGRTLDEALVASDEKAASEAVVALADAAGRLHAATLDGHAEFDGLRDALAPREFTPISRAAAGLSAAEPDVTGWLTAVGTRVPRGLAESLAALADAVAHPGPFTTFTHGDMAPSNNHFSATGVRLLDFEYGGVRSALYDTLLWNLFCPFPPTVIERADAAHRSALATALSGGARRFPLRSRAGRGGGLADREHVAVVRASGARSGWPLGARAHRSPGLAVARRALHGLRGRRTTGADHRRRGWARSRARRTLARRARANVRVAGVPRPRSVVVEREPDRRPRRVRPLDAMSAVGGNDQMITRAHLHHVVPVGES